MKPANVLLSGSDSSEHAYITDFGVARNVASTSGLTKTGRFVGTLDYVAPEQIRGGEVDARADVYALGCLLFKLLTGEVPFPRDGEAARLYAHLNDEPPAASLFTPMVPKALDRVIARAMAKSPGERYPSAGDLGRAAAAALSGGEPELERAHGGDRRRGDRHRGDAAERRAGARLDGDGADLRDDRDSRRDRAASAAGPGHRRAPQMLAVIGGIVAVAVVALAVALLSGGGKGGSQEASKGQGGRPRAGEGGGRGEGQAHAVEEGRSSSARPTPPASAPSRASSTPPPSSPAVSSATSPFARIRFGISKRQVSELSALEPRAPISVRGTFRKYVEAIVQGPPF